MGLIQCTADLSFGNRNIIGESNRYIVYENSTLEKCHYGVFDKKSGERLFTNLLKDIPCIDGISYVYLKDSTLFYEILAMNYPLL